MFVVAVFTRDKQTQVARYTFTTAADALDGRIAIMTKWKGMGVITTGIMRAE